jgi:putative flippase GtrA
MREKTGLARLAVVVRSLGVGVWATATDLGVLALLVSGLGVAPRVASLPALAAGVVVQFLGNKLLAFHDRSSDWFCQGLKFLAVEALGIALNALAFDRVVALTHLPYLPVRLMTTSLVYVCVSLPLWSLIFEPGTARGA